MSTLDLEGDVARVSVGAVDVWSPERNDVVPTSQVITRYANGHGVSIVHDCFRNVATVRFASTHLTDRAFTVDDDLDGDTLEEVAARCAAREPVDEVAYRG